MRVSLLESDCLVNDDDDLVEYVASSENNIHQFFSPQQLQVIDQTLFFLGMSELLTNVYTNGFVT